MKINDMETLLILGLVAFVVIAFCIAKEQISKSENRKSSELKEDISLKFKHLSRMSTQLRHS